MVFVGDVEDYSEAHENDVSDEGEPAEHCLPTAHFQVSQYIDSDEKASQSAGDMSRIAGPVLQVVGVSTVNCNTDISASEEQESTQPDPIELHFWPVLWKKIPRFTIRTAKLIITDNDNAGQMRRNQSIDASTGAGQVTERVTDIGAQTARD